MFTRKRTIAIAAVASEVLFEEKKRWSRNWLDKRGEKDTEISLVKELRLQEPEDFRNYLRMDTEVFSELLELVAPRIKKENTIMRESISPEDRLIATLRFLAVGRSFEDMKFGTRISAQSLGRIIPETCKAIYEVLRGEYFKFPTTQQEWRMIALKFESRWQFPNCGGAIDGKHVRITRPPGTGAQFYNYKNFYSIVLLALVNANYEFVYADVGKNGRNSDGGILESTTFFHYLQKNMIHLPEPQQNVENLNFVFLGDEAFGLHQHLVKPYSQHDLTYQKRIFNYRLSRARNVVENAFGIITSRFRVLHTTINMNTENIQYVVMAICTLHNFLRKNSRQYFNSRTVDSVSRSTFEIQRDGEWRSESADLVGLQITRGRQCLEGKENRNKYLEYFNGKGSVRWQQEMVQKGRA